MKWLEEKWEKKQVGPAFLRHGGETISRGFQSHNSTCVLFWSFGMSTENHPGFGQGGFISNLRGSPLCGMAGR